MDTPRRPTLTELDFGWAIPVRGWKRRYVGGVEGLRFATDSGSMFRIDESEFASGSPLRTIRDDWSMLTGPGEVTRTPYSLAHPHEVRQTSSSDVRLALRYGRAWVSHHYVALAMHFGGETIETGGRLDIAVVPDIAAIMPLNFDAGRTLPTFRQRPWSLARLASAA